MNHFKTTKLEILRFFCVDNGLRISEKDEKGRELVVQCIMRNVFDAGKITYY